MLFVVSFIGVRIAFTIQRLCVRITSAQLRAIWPHTDNDSN